MPAIPLRVDAAHLRKLLTSESPPAIDAMRSIVDPSRAGVILGYFQSQEVSFIAVNATASHPGAQAVQRSAVALLKPKVAITYDIIESEDDTVTGGSWAVIGNGLDFTRLETSDSSFLHVLRFHAQPTAENISTLDLAGVLISDWAILFHTETTSAKSAVSFVIEEGPRKLLQFLITGLAPGSWQIWRNGWLEEISTGVKPSEGTLHFEGRAGSYFVRRL